MVVYCYKCGRQNNDNQSYCVNCGTELIRPPSMTEPNAAVPANALVEPEHAAPTPTATGPNLDIKSSPWTKILIVLGIIYLLNPSFGIDLLPDGLPIVGNMDELGISYYIFRNLTGSGPLKLPRIG